MTPNWVFGRIWDTSASHKIIVDTPLYVSYQRHGITKHSCRRGRIITQRSSLTIRNKEKKWNKNSQVVSVMPRSRLPAHKATQHQHQSPQKKSWLPAATDFSQLLTFSRGLVKTAKNRLSIKLTLCWRSQRASTVENPVISENDSRLPQQSGDRKKARRL